MTETAVLQDLRMHGKTQGSHGTIVLRYVTDYRKAVIETSLDKLVQMTSVS
jgi:hypothetical protein